MLPLYQEYFHKLRIELVPMPTPAEVTKYSGLIADKDTPVLVSAIKGKADFLVTGDKKHFDKVKKAGTFSFIITNPADFLEQLAALLKEEQE